jgi:RNA polymerase sigma-70 factor, ECF subfamily
MARIEDVPGLEDAARDELARGDLGAAAERAIRGYGPQLLGYLAAVLRDADEADDVFADACEKLLRGIDGFRSEGTLRAWAYRIVWCALQDHLRDRRRARERRYRSHELSEAAAAVRESTRPYLRTSVRDRFDDLRARLAPDEQTLLILRLGRGLSWREVSQVLSRPGLPEEEAALRKRFERVKLKLRELARSEGLIPSP